MKYFLRLFFLRPLVIQAKVAVMAVIFYQASSKFMGTGAEGGLGATLLVFMAIFFLIYPIFYDLSFPENLNWLLSLPFSKLKIFGVYIALKILHLFSGLLLFLLTMLVCFLPQNPEWTSKLVPLVGKFFELIFIQLSKFPEWVLTSGHNLGLFLLAGSLLFAGLFGMVSFQKGMAKFKGPTLFFQRLEGRLPSYLLTEGKLDYKFYPLFFLLGILFVTKTFNFWVSEIVLYYLMATFFVLAIIFHNIEQLKIPSPWIRKYVWQLAFLMMTGGFGVSAMISVANIKYFRANPRSGENLLENIHYLGVFSPRLEVQDFLDYTQTSKNLTLKQMGELINSRAFGDAKRSILERKGITLLLPFLRKSSWESVQTWLNKEFTGVLLREEEKMIFLSHIGKLDSPVPALEGFFPFFLGGNTYGQKDIIAYLKSSDPLYQYAGLYLSILFGDKTLNPYLFNLLTAPPYNRFPVVQNAISYINGREYSFKELFALHLSGSEPLPPKSFCKGNQWRGPLSRTPANRAAPLDFRFLYCVKPHILQKERPLLAKYLTCLNGRNECRLSRFDI